MATTIGGIVLCGGRSTRMGRPKALLPFGDEVLLQRIGALVGSVVSPVVVVAARDQPLPDLPPDVRIVRDELDDSGPLAGLATGLAALGNEVDAAYVTGCDAPLLKAEFVQRLVDLLTESDIAIPFDGRFSHPLAAVYRTSVATAARRLMAAGHLRLLDLLEHHRVRTITALELRDVDPTLQTLRNVNTEEEYQAALRDAGLA